MKRKPTKPQRSDKALRDCAARCIELRRSLDDLQGFYDRVTGTLRLDCGWTAADVKRLAEIRAMATGSK